MLGALFLLAQLAAGVVSTGRPLECSDANGHAANVWERAKSPELGRYCDLVASASSKLAGTRTMAESALAAAREAERTLPGHAAPRALEGRALSLLGRLDDAVLALRDATSRDVRTLDDPATLLAWARALARTGHLEEANKAYHALLPRAAALPSADRAAAAIEAALVAMATGPAGVDDAAAALREAMRDAQDETVTLAVMALALALDRRGDLAEASALVAERVLQDPRAVLQTKRAHDLLAVAPKEGPALIARALQDQDPAGAREAWREYISVAPEGPWAAHARARLEALGERRGAHRAKDVR
jgi:tetratricopeptide (TPR) repeat protein